MQATDLSDRLALAAAEDTPSEVLEKLAKDLEIEVRRAVAGNPNAPIDTLLELGVEFPDHITANPIFSIQLLAEPESRFVRLSLARSSFTSEQVLATLSQIPDEEILCSIAQNPATPITILEKLVYDTPNLKYEYGEDDSPSERLFSIIAKNPNSSVELIGYLATLDWTDKYALAENPKTPLKFLKQFATWDNRRMDRSLLRNPEIPASVLETLASASDGEIRTALKNHPHISPAAIDICNFIEGKPGTPAHILERLASDRRLEVRRLVAQNPRTPISGFRILAQNPQKEICFELASNPSLPTDILEETARYLVKEYGEIRHYGNEWDTAFLAIVKHSNVTSAILESIADLTSIPWYGGGEVLHAIAKHDKASHLAFIKIARHYQNRSHNEIYMVFGSNPNVPAEALEILIEGFFSGNVAIALTEARHVFTHPNFPTRLLAEIATSSDRIPLLQLVAQHPNTPANLVNTFARDSERNLRLFVAKNPDAPIELLREFLVDSDPKVRMALAANPNLPQ